MLLILSSLFAFNILLMWQKSVAYSKDGSMALDAYIQASNFLSNNLGQKDIALVPNSVVFAVANPELDGRLVTYASIWQSAGVVYQANVTESDVLRVRNYLRNLLEENSDMKFVIVDWVDSYASAIFGDGVKSLLNFFKEVQTYNFTLSTGWSSAVRVYQRVPVVQLLGMSLSFPPAQYSVLPSNASIVFGLDGAVVEKIEDSVNFYVVLPSAINVSSQTFLKLQVRLDLDNVNFTVVFYYDKDGDGRFSGYGVDFVRSVVLNQAKQGWVKGEPYSVVLSIPMSDCPVVNVALCLSGDSRGVATFSNLAIFKELTSED